MEKTIYLTNLYDIYNLLLTDKQKEYFKLYYFDDLTLDEISENLGVTKANVSKKILAATKVLESMEEKLRLLEKRNKLKQEFASEDNILKRIERIIE